MNLGWARVEEVGGFFPDSASRGPPTFPSPLCDLRSSRLIRSIALRLVMTTRICQRSLRSESRANWPSLRASVETVEGAEGHVLLVGDLASVVPDFRRAQADEAMHVGVPELIGWPPDSPSLTTSRCIRNRERRSHPVINSRDPTLDLEDRLGGSVKLKIRDAEITPSDFGILRWVIGLGVENPLRG